MPEKKRPAPKPKPSVPDSDSGKKTVTAKTAAGNRKAAGARKPSTPSTTKPARTEGCVLGERTQERSGEEPQCDTRVR